LTGRGATIRPHLSVLVDYPTLLTLTTTTHHPTCTAQTAGTTEATGAPPCPAGTFPLLASPLTPGALTPGTLNPAVFESGQPVPRAVLDRLLCDAAITRIVFGPDSQILDVGRTHRTYPTHLRRAIIARDKHCQYPSCHAPPRMCQAHHSKHWTRDHGTTDARTGVLLCTHHHTVVHDNHIEIHWEPGHGWQFTDQNGQILTPD
ncbi:HNH endonuclease signature motif containing protein, partial [Pengzhenrongella frigida]